MLRKALAQTLHHLDGIRARLIELQPQYAARGQTPCELGGFQVVRKGWLEAVHPYCGVIVLDSCLVAIQTAPDVTTVYGCKGQGEWSTLPGNFVGMACDEKLAEALVEALTSAATKPKGGADA